MYVSRVRIDGVLGFHGSRAVDLTLTRPDGSHAGWTVLAGRNGSGKTTLLRAIAIGLSAPPQAYPLAPDLQNWASADPAAIELTVEFEDLRVAAHCGWTRPEGRARSRPQVHWAYRQSPSGPELSVVDWEVLSADLLAGFGPFRRLAPEGTPAGSPLATMFDDEEPLADGLAWLVNEHHRSLEQREGAAQSLAKVLELLGDGFLPDGLRVSRVDSEGLWIERDGEEYPLRELSGGHRTAVALVLNLLAEFAAEDGHGGLFPAMESREGHPVVTLRAVVLIDEVDAHLHVSWQQRIGYWLKSHFPNVQFVVSTHSPYICQAADPGGLIRLGSPADATAPEVVSEDLHNRVVYGSGDDAILSELFGLESPFSLQAERLRRRAGDLEEAMMEGQATDDDRAEYDELSARLTSSLSTRAAEVAALLGRRR